MIQLVRVPGQDSARALVSQPGLIPLVILRGSGDSTRSLAADDDLITLVRESFTDLRTTIPVDQILRRGHCSPSAVSMISPSRPVLGS